MRTEMRYAAVALALVAAAGGVRAEERPAASAAPTAPSKATLAVLPFQASDAISRRYQKEIDLLEDNLVRAFVATNKFDVLERSKIDAVIQEHQFATSSFGDPANASNVGKLSGAQYLVMGNVHELAISVAREEIPYVHEWKCTESASLRIELRVVQSKLGRIVAAYTGDGKESAPFRQSGPCRDSADRMLERAVGRISEVLVGKVLDAVYPLRVVQVAGDVVTLNRGEGGDFKVGSTFDCFTRGEAIIDPDTGDQLGADETPVGAVIVTQVMAKLSKARATEGTAVPVDAVCRLARREPLVAPPKRVPQPKVNW
jgi:curli biogenesis system outer membrane secretion channel CsgG